jgi:hypothetical protein
MFHYKIAIYILVTVAIEKEGARRRKSMMTRRKQVLALCANNLLLLPIQEVSLFLGWEGGKLVKREK